MDTLQKIGNCQQLALSLSAPSAHLLRMLTRRAPVGRAARGDASEAATMGGAGGGCSRGGVDRDHKPARQPQSVLRRHVGRQNCNPTARGELMTLIPFVIPPQ